MQSSESTSQASGLRYDQGKNQLDLIPSEWIEGLGLVLTMGANKYEPRNWEKGMKWGKVMGPLLRHAMKFWRGEQNDDESDLHHMLHVAWNALALYSYDLHKVGEDDRSQLGK